ncbi:uncharacterized protein LOC135108260 [Scylla paramamosain]|uniref:uncharacterized protein LOC135108260 n=1 Tax=Scylla paramamosain TaxID=85552 RepID=UPI003082D6E3
MRRKNTMKDIQGKKKTTSLNIIQRLLTCEHVKTLMANAIDCLKNEKSCPVLISEFTSLRDTLITVFMVSSLRRIMEFSEFRLSEYLERKIVSSEESMYVIKIARHKTAVKGPSLVYLTTDQEKALTSYIQFYRPLAVPCLSPDCFIFPFSTNQIGGCCMKLDFSGLGKVIRRVATLAGLDTKITSRILRRSQITALWESDADPGWRTKVADQCSHSLDTAARYYEYSEKVKPGLDVVKKLSRIREAMEKELNSKDGEDDETVLPSIPMEGLQEETQHDEGEDGDEALVHPLKPMEGLQEQTQHDEGEDGDEAFVHPSNSTKAGSGLAQLQEPSSHVEPNVDLLGNDSNPDDGLVHPSVSELSMPLSVGLPDDLSVGTIWTAKTDNSGEPRTPVKPSTASTYKDIVEAIESCNQSQDKDHYIVRWNAVREYLIRKNPAYQLLTVKQLRDKYKYMKKVKKMMK